METKNKLIGFSILVLGGMLLIGAAYFHYETPRTQQASIYKEDSSALIANDALTKKQEIISLKKSLTQVEEHLGLTHPSTGQTLYKLGRAYEAQGQYDDAEALYIRYQVAKKAEEKAKRPGEKPEYHPPIKLTKLYELQGKFGKAEAAYLSTLKETERLFGKDHIATANILIRMAKLYEKHRQYLKAQTTYSRALSIQEDRLSADHPKIALSLNNLGLVYKTQDKYDQAEIHFLRAIAIYEKTNGPRHLRTAISLINLASLYETQSQYDKAKPILIRAQAIREEALGPGHPDTIKISKRRANLDKAQKQ